MTKTAEWYKNWFDSPYYHVLYQHRSYAEAGHFIERLIAELQPPPNSHFLDKACGRGRHAGILGKMGFGATGLDLSPNNIAWAKRYRGKFAGFDCHDMREVYRESSFDFVLSLFTSFGYFSDADNLKVLKAAYVDLKPGGIYVLDFFNLTYVLNHLKETEKKTSKGIKFLINRQACNNEIVKEITIKDSHASYAYVEKVKSISPDELSAMLRNCGFSIKTTFGDYDLQSFNPSQSPRFIVTAQKI